MSTHWVILGGGGAFALHTSRYILHNDYNSTVTAIGRNFLRAPPFTLGIDKHPRFKYRAFHTTYEHDLLIEFLERNQPDYIVNFAAQGEGATSWKHSWRYFETNSMGLARLVEQLDANPVLSRLKRFIHIGTSELYGSVSEPVNEQAPIRPSSPYSASKAAFDLYLQSITRTHSNFAWTIIRPSNCYCPGQLLHRIIPKAIVCGLTNKKLPLHGGGNAKKSYMHARDLARAIFLVAKNEGTIHATLNAGPELPISIREVVEKCAQAMDVKFSDLVHETGDRFGGNDACYWLDSSLIKQYIGWTPQITWEQGLAEMVEWGHEYYDHIKDLSQDYVFRG